MCIIIIVIMLISIIIDIIIIIIIIIIIMIRIVGVIWLPLGPRRCETRPRPSIVCFKSKASALDSSVGSIF